MAVVLFVLALFLVGAFAIGLRKTALALAFLRPSGDRVFNAVKDLAGSDSGPGASLNLGILALAAAAVVRRPAALFAPPVLGWLAFVLAAGASATAAPDPAVSIRLLLTLATYGAVLALTHAVVDSIAMARRMILAVVLSSVVPAGIGLVELLANPEILLGDERLLGTFTHPNILAFYLVTVIAAILFVNGSSMFDPSPGARRLLLGSAGLLLVLLLATKTRSAWGALALILLVQALIVDRRWLGLLALAPLLALVPGVNERFADLFAGNTNDAYAQLNSFAWRQLLWGETLRWLGENPPRLVGHGLDHYIHYVPLFFIRVIHPEGVGTHNALLQIWFETGMLGVVGFGTAIILLVGSLARRLRMDLAGASLMLAACGGYLLAAYSDNVLDYLQYQWAFWFLMGAVSASTRLMAADARLRRTARDALPDIYPPELAQRDAPT
jgi:O-antigen ligase